MSNQTQNDMTLLHPILQDCCKKIYVDIIRKYNMPIRIFETGRSHQRHQNLLDRGKTQNIMSRHLYNLENDPPMYALAVDYVYFDGKWSWNLRNTTTLQWYLLFGNMVLDLCPEVEWKGMDRNDVNYNHFELRNDIIVANLDIYPCVCNVTL